jgi:hypothetical protein
LNGANGEFEECKSLVELGSKMKSKAQEIRNMLNSGREELGLNFRSENSPKNSIEISSQDIVQHHSVGIGDIRRLAQAELQSNLNRSSPIQNCAHVRDVATVGGQGSAKLAPVVLTSHSAGAAINLTPTKTSFNVNSPNLHSFERGRLEPKIQARGSFTDLNPVKNIGKLHPVGVSKVTSTSPKLSSSLSNSQSLSTLTYRVKGEKSSDVKGNFNRLIPYFLTNSFSSSSPIKKFS